MTGYDDDNQRDTRGKDVTYDPIVIPKGPLPHVGEPRLDTSYWMTPLPMRAYMRVSYAICGALLTAWILDGLNFADWFQWAIGTLTFAYVLTFRWIRPNGLGNVRERLVDGNEQAMRELRDGDYTGVPTFLVPDKDRDRVRKERRQDAKRN